MVPPPRPPQPPQHPPPSQEQLDCWACDATVAVPLDPDTGCPALAFSCGWCGAVTRVEEEEAERRNLGGGGEQQSRRRSKKARLPPARRILAKLLPPLASALSIAAATALGVGWVLPALFDEAKHPRLLLLADAVAAVVSFNIAVHFAALLAQSLGIASSGPKQVVVAAAGVGRTPEDEDTVSVSFSGDSGLSFSGGGGGSVSGGGAASAGGSAAAAVFVGSNVPRGAYAGHERCELCVEAAAWRSSTKRKNRSSGGGGGRTLAPSQFRPFSAPAPIPPPPPARVSFSSWRKRGHRPPGAAHCLVCDACVADVDHHCSFVGTCVSLRAGKGGAGGEEEGKTATATATTEQQRTQRRRREPPRHHPSGRHFALLLFWLLAGSLYAALGSAALLVARRAEAEASWRRATSILLKQGKPLFAPPPPPPPQPAIVRWRLGKAPATTAAPTPSRLSRAAAPLLALVEIVPVLLVTSPPWMAAALGLAALSLAAGLGVLFVAAEAARRVAAGESAADEMKRRRRGGEDASSSPRCSPRSLFEHLSDLFGGGHPASWLLPPWGNDDDSDEGEKED